MRMLSASSLRIASLLSVTGMILVSGCAGGKGASPATSAVGLIKGEVHGGQSPVQGALLKLYHTDPTATTYGAPGVLIGTSYSDQNGAFTIGSNSGTSATAANCPAGAQTYITAAGGYIPNQPTAINNNMLQMAALGDCASISSSTGVELNEVTTVAAAYALSGFMTTSLDPSTSFYTANVSAPAANSAAVGSATPTNPSGLAHAFMNAAKLANTASGTANFTTAAYTGGTTVNGSVPATEINTLADMMQSCVNTVSGTSGALASIPVSSGGSGYGGLVTITGGTGSGATGNALLNASGVVTGLQVTNAGTGYSPAITISGNGSGASLATTLSGGAITGATIENGGSGYGAIATVSPSSGFPSGTGAVLAASSSAGVPTSYTVLNAGSGYGPLVTVSAPPYGGTLSTVTAGMSTSVNAGGVYQLTEVTGGTGYGPSVTFSSASGSGAVISATLSGSAGAVTALSITTAGSGYPASTTFPLIISAPYGTGTTATATGTATSSSTGSISSVQLTSGGSGYTLPTLTIDAPPGGGTAATGTVTTVKAGGVYIVSVTTNGTGYTMPTVAVTGTGTGGNAYVSTVVGGKISGTVIAGKYGVSGTAGSGYGPILTLPASPASGTQATATANVTGGTISGITITAAGTGYSPVVTITGGTTNATGTATIGGGGVTMLNLTAGGAGYNTPAVTIAPPPSGGTTATATAITANGAVTGFTLTNSGSGYSAAPTVTVAAPPAGTTAVAGTAVLTPDASSGNTAPASLCDTLFTLTPSISGVIPNNTLQAYINLARNPYPSAAAMSATSGLYSLINPSPAFLPTLTSAGLPADWSISIVYGTTATNPTAIAVPYWPALDDNDTVYFSRSSTSTTTPLLYGIGSYGTTVPVYANSPVGTGGRGIAVDQLGNLWEATNSTAIFQLSATGGTIVNTYTTPVSSSTDVKVDAGNNVWVSSSVTTGVNMEEFAYTAGSPGTWTLGPTATLPAGGNGIAIDAFQNVWGTAYSTAGGTTLGTYATVLANTGTAAAPNYNATNGTITPLETTFSGGAARPFGVAIDASGNAWYDFFGQLSVSTTGVQELTPNSATTALTSLTAGPFILGNSINPNGNILNTINVGLPAIDGAGTMFVPDVNGTGPPAAYGVHMYSTITGNTLSPTAGITSCALASSSSTSCGATSSGAVYNPKAPAIDSTGSVWLGLAGPSSTGGVTQIIGLAAPTYPVVSIGKPGLSPGLSAVAPLP